MEQPTIFYAIAFALVLMGFDRDQRLAGLGLCRLAHPAQPRPGDGQHGHIRFPMFAVATFCLLGLTVHAALFIIHHGPLHHGRAEAGGQLDVGRPAELADGPDPIETIAASDQNSASRAKVAGLQLT